MAVRLRFVALYAALFTAFGVASPFLPAYLAGRGLPPDALGLVLAAGTAARLVAGPAAATAADRLQARRAMLAICAAAAGLIAGAYLAAGGLWPLLLVSVAQAMVLAPLVPLADALALGAAPPLPGAPLGRFDYGWIRGAGSAAFVAGTTLSGQLVGGFGMPVIIWLNGGLLLCAAACAAGVPDLPGRRPDMRRASGVPVPGRRRFAGALALLRRPAFRRLLMVAALIQGSHAFHDGFAVIGWRAAGLSPAAIGILWSESVVAEVAVFLVLGRLLLRRLGPAGASVLAGTAGLVRWTVLAQTAALPAVALVEPLHGLTFALQHLASMRLVAEMVPPDLAATAQALYGTVAIGLATALLTLASGPLYERFGLHGFWTMAALCAAAIIPARRLRAG